MSDKFAGGILAGSASVSIPFVLRKTADNTEATGKVAADMTLSYWRQGGVRVAITASDLATVNSAYSSGGVKEVDATNEPGLYRLDVPDAAVATGADWCVVSVKVASSYVFHERFALTTNVVQSGDNFARLGAPAGASLAADVAAIKAETASVQGDTNDIQTRLPAALVGGRMDSSTGAMAANVMTAAAAATDLTTELQTGLATAAALATAQTSIDDLPTNAELATALGTADDAVLAQVALVKAKTDNLPPDPADASDIAAAFSSVASTLSGLPAAVWAVATRVLTAGTNIVLAKGTGVTGFNDLDAAGVRAAVGLASADLDSQLGALPTAAENADQVWDEALAGHLTAGSTGEALSDAGGAGTPPTAAQNAAAVWDEARASHVAAGSFGQGVASVSGAVGSVTGNVGGNVVGSVASVTADVGITQAGADKVWASAARSLTTFGTLVADVTTAVWGAATRILTAGTNIVLAKGVGVTGFNDLSAAQVNTEADTALSDVGLTTTVTGRIDAAISTRLATAGYTAPDNASITAIKAKTDNLPSDPADASDVAAAFGIVNGNLSTIAGYLDTEVAAIKAKTDALPASPAATSDIPTAAQNADKLLGRNLAGGSDGGRTVQDALRPLRNKTSISGGTLTVTAEDDLTAAWTAAVTTAPGDPLVAVNPA